MCVYMFMGIYVCVREREKESICVCIGNMEQFLRRLPLECTKFRPEVCVADH